MTTYISMLRGINVSGKNKIKMNDLKSLYEELDFKKVTTYIQSGNVVFDSLASDIQTLSKMIEKKIQIKFGFVVPVVIRKADGINKIIKNNPFLKNDNVDKDQLYIVFLSAKPTKANLGKIDDVKSGKDEYQSAATEVYIYCPGGFGKTKFTNNFFEKKLNLTATTRNWKTINKLNEIGHQSLA